jgi:hypothetical protein
MNVSRRKAGGSRIDTVVIVALGLVGIWTVLGLESLGWTPDLSGTVHRVLTGFLFLFVAGSALERHRLRRRLVEIQEALNMLLYGKNYARDREAIRILIVGLSSKDADVREKAWKNLKKLTGQDFALDRDVWATWWEANEKRFALKAKRPEE